MNKRIYGLLPDPAIINGPCRVQDMKTPKGKKLEVNAQVIGCYRCGRTGCTLYSSGPGRICKECRNTPTEEVIING